MYIDGHPRGPRRDRGHSRHDLEDHLGFYGGGAGGLGDLSEEAYGRPPYPEMGYVAAATDAKGTLFNIEDSDRGTEATVEKMAELVKKGSFDPFVIKNAMRIVRAAGVPRKAYLKEIEALFRYAQGTHPTLPGLRYFKDTWHAEKLQSARRTEEFGGSDCDDLVIHLGAHLLSIGHGPIRLVVVAADPQRPDEYSHVYMWVAHPEGNAVDPEDGSRWIPLDPTVGKPMGWEVENPFRKAYFQVSRAD